MAGRSVMLFAVLCAVSLAGCLGGGGAEPADAVDGQAVGPEAPTSGNATPQPRPLAWDGRVPLTAHGCMAAGCIYSGGARQEHLLSGTVGGNLTLTWEGDNELLLTVEPCARACLHEVEGTSPLALDIPWLDPEVEHFLVVQHPRGGNLGGMRVAPETPFRVEGTVMVA